MPIPTSVTNGLRSGRCTAAGSKAPRRQRSASVFTSGENGRFGSFMGRFPLPRSVELQRRRDANQRVFHGPPRTGSVHPRALLQPATARLDATSHSPKRACSMSQNALNRPHEMAIHLEGAVNNGCSAEEIRETLTHTVAYCGFPAAIDALR